MITLVNGDDTNVILASKWQGGSKDGYWETNKLTRAGNIEVIVRTTIE